MTDKEKLDKLVAEIERLKKIVDDPILSDHDLIIGERNAYIRLLSFYNTMQKEAKNEAKIKVEQIMAEVDAKFPKFAKEYEDAQELANGNLEKEIQHYLCKEWAGDPIILARHFAEWQKQQMMANTADAIIGLPYENKYGGYIHLIYASRPLPVGDNKIAIIFKED